MRLGCLPFQDKPIPITLRYTMSNYIPFAFFQPSVVFYSVRDMYY